MNEYQQNFMDRAIELALAGVAAGAGGPFGAVIVKGDEIVAEAHNQVVADTDPTAHAEITAIRRAAKELDNRHLSGCVLYASCEPCPMCLSASQWARLDKVYYAASQAEANRAGFDDQRFYGELAKPAAERALPSAKCDHPQAWQPFQAWLEKGDRIPY